MKEMVMTSVPDGEMTAKTVLPLPDEPPAENSTWQWKNIHPWKMYLYLSVSPIENGDMLVYQRVASGE